MSCAQATSPVNISGNMDDKCTMKCSYAFSYPLTDLTVENKGAYLRFGPDPQQNPPVSYNNERYMVQELRLYQPSLHTWGGQHTTGELIVVHSSVGTGSGLLVCVPVTDGAAITAGSDILATLLARAADSAPSSGSNAGVVRLPTFTCGKFIPYSRPFFSYVGTLPYEPCSGTYNYVVLWEDSAVGLSSSASATLGSVIAKNTTQTVDNPGGLFYNPSGAVNSQGSGEGIYIECQPTGDDGEIIVPHSLADNWLDDLKKKHPDILKVGKAIVVFIAVFALAFVIWKMIGKLGISAAAAAPHGLTAASAALDASKKLQQLPIAAKLKSEEEANLAKRRDKKAAAQAESSSTGIPMTGMMGMPGAMGMGAMGMQPMGAMGMQPMGAMGMQPMGAMGMQPMGAARANPT